VQENGCTYTQGYWKNHNQYQTNRNQYIFWPISENTQLCGKSWLEWFDETPKGNKWIVLAHQWIAAKLNVANNASDTAVADALIEAEGLLNGCTNLKDEAKKVNELSILLGDYNEGKIGPGHCDETVIPNIDCECLGLDNGNNLQYNINNALLQVSSVNVPDNVDQVDFDLNIDSGDAYLVVTDKKGKKYSSSKRGVLSVVSIPNDNIGVIYVAVLSNGDSSGYFNVTYTEGARPYNGPYVGPIVDETNSATQKGNNGGNNGVNNGNNIIQVALICLNFILFFIH
jgi:hypothetical protein